MVVKRDDISVCMSELKHSPSLVNKIVLVIDDDPVLLKSLANWFVDAGCNVMTAADGAVGLKKFAQVRPDLVVTDIIMPDREGVETIVAMKRQDTTVPIIAISGGGRIGPGEFLSLALRLGANAALAKPFRSKELLATAASLLDQAANVGPAGTRPPTTSGAGG